MKRLIRITTLTSILLLTPHSYVLADQADLDREVSNYISVISGADFEAAKVAMETLRWSGVSDVTVYDPIAEKLDQIKENKDDKKEAAWYAKVLGFSGNEKYRAALELIATDSSPKNVKRYARIGLKHLDNHRSWNSIISEGTLAAPAGKLEETRIINMLGAKNHELMRLGAKRISHSYKGDEVLIGVAAERLAKEWRSVDKDNGPQIDGVSWLMKAIGTSNQAVHQALLEEIAVQSDHKKIKKYAKKALKALQK